MWIPPFVFKGIRQKIFFYNENGQSSQDIPALWNKFMAEGITEKILQ